MTSHKDRCEVADYLDRMAPTQTPRMRKAFQDQAHTMRQWTFHDTDSAHTSTPSTGRPEYLAYYAGIGT